jgi:magnesium chelatase family protein
VQLRRQGVCNNNLDNAAVERHCTPNAADLDMLERAMQRLGISARGYHRLLKVARTIADMAERPRIEMGHLAEALALRSLERHRGGGKGARPS